MSGDDVTDLEIILERVGWPCQLHDDFHDYPDSAEKQPWHFATLKCERCGKEFTI